MQRTPQKLDALLREVAIGDGIGVLLLDEFESFITESSSLKWVLKLIRSKGTNCEVPVVMVCNAIDKMFLNISNLSTVVEFLPYTRDELYSTLLLLSSKVRRFCHLPPMDCFFISNMSSGNLCQTVNQLHFLYYRQNSPLKTLALGLGKKRQKLRKVQSTIVRSHQDSAIKMWSVSHRATSVDCFIDDPDMLDSVSGMNKDFMTGLGENLSKEYVLYFHNGGKTTLDVIASCAENISAADCGLVSDDKDQHRMYESENSSQWAADNVHFMACMCTTIRLLRHKAKNGNILPQRKSMRRNLSLLPVVGGV